MALPRRIRIGDWLVDYDDAEVEVVLERHAADILKAKRGNDQECMNSQCIKAQRNRHVFPHNVYMVSTIKSRVYIVDQLDDSGEPSHAVRYELSKRDRALIDSHDRLGVAETGDLVLRIPKDPKGSPKRASYPGRFADTSPDARYAGDGSEVRGLRPVTSHSLGAKARVVVAVGAAVDELWN